MKIRSDHDQELHQFGDVPHITSGTPQNLILAHGPEVVMWSNRVGVVTHAYKRCRVHPSRRHRRSVPLGNSVKGQPFKIQNKFWNWFEVFSVRLPCFPVLWVSRVFSWKLAICRDACPGCLRMACLSWPGNSENILVLDLYARMLVTEWNLKTVVMHMICSTCTSGGLRSRSRDLVFLDGITCTEPSVGCIPWTNM